MFKAKLIDSSRYYGQRRMGLILSFLSAMLLGLVANAYQMSFWYVVFIVGGWVVIALFIVKNTRKLLSSINSHTIEMDHAQILVRSKDGISSEVIDPSRFDAIIVKEEYSIPQGSFMDLINEVGGRTIKNYLILLEGKDKRRLDFELDSKFMILQLEKVIDSWTSQGLVVKRSNQEQ
jgi:hypothetical protein